MADVVIELSMSLDGFIAGPGDDQEHPLGKRGGEHLFDWYLSGSEPHPPGTMFKPEGANRAAVDEMYARFGAFVSGRRTYDIVNGWQGTHPVNAAPVFILTRHPPSNPPKGKSKLNFVTDGIESAIDQARSAAGEKDVHVAGGANVVQQALNAGLIDELQIHLAPVLLGGGVRLLDGLDVRRVTLVAGPVAVSSSVTHLTYRVERQ